MVQDYEDDNDYDDDEDDDSNNTKQCFGKTRIRHFEQLEPRSIQPLTWLRFADISAVLFHRFFERISLGQDRFFPFRAVIQYYTV
jgi:hypothetical protein